LGWTNKRENIECGEEYLIIKKIKIINLKIKIKLNMINNSNSNQTSPIVQYLSDSEVITIEE